MRLSSLARLVLSLAAALCCCSPLHAHATSGAVFPAIGTLRLIGEQRLAHGQDYEGTVVGGLSGIDYDPRTNTWILASDDRSQYSPARFYTARLDYGPQGFAAVDLTGVHFFKQADGSNYPGMLAAAASRGEVADIEAIRFDPCDGSIWYTSEGVRLMGLDPFVMHADAHGAHPTRLPLPPQFHETFSRASGPRDNLNFEELTFAPDGKSLWVSMEGPRYQDGPVPTPAHGAMARFTRYGRDGAVLAQVAYPIDPIPAAPGRGKAADNGVSDILAVNDHAFLVLERSAVQDARGRYANYIRLYEMDTAGATDVRGFSTLAGAAYQPVRKRLVLDLNTLRLTRLDNLEGMAWGPRLPNGHASLVLVSDDNFNASQVTQLLAFEVEPR